MDNIKLQAQVRDISSKSVLKQLRKSGRVAASVYGHGFESVAISLDIADLAAAVKTEAGLRALMEMEIEGADKDSSGTVVIKRVQKDPMTRKVIHVDFQRVQMTEKLTTEVPLTFTGIAAGVKEGGIVEHIMDSIQVRCLPGNIPSGLEVDITDLEIGQAVYIKDLPLPEGVEALAPEEEMVLAVRPPHVQVEPTAEEAEGEEAEAAPAAETEGEGA